MSPAAATLLIALSVAPAPASAQVQAEPPGLPASAQLQASSAARPPLPDSSMSAASRALARGLPWRATRILDAVVRDPVARTPDAVYLAATAAARWGGWSAVERLLASEAWLDTLYGARGRVMLARAVLEQGRDSLALAHAALAADEAADPEVRGAALVVMARGLEGVDARDSAAGAWLRASRLLPGVSDWLRLRAAGVIADSAARWSTYASLSAPAARAHVPEIEAALREKLGDYLGAARAYEALGDRATALRLRLAAASDSTQRDSVRAALVDLVRRGGAGDARASVAVLDSAFGTLAPEDELVVARTASTAGLPARAVAGYGRAFEAGLGTPKDRFDRGAALVRLGRYAEAAAEFGRVPARDRLGGAAAYQRARALLRDGRDRTASKALHAVIARFPRDSAAAAPALVLLADLATDARKDAEARRLFGELAVRFPRSRFAPGARFRGALIALLQGHANTAAKELDALAASRYAGEEVLAATYWAGRAWEAAGDTSRALDRWRALVSREPTSYYAGLAERRLGAPSWSPPPAPDSFAAIPEIDSAVARAAELEQLGLLREAGWEYERLSRDAGDSAERLLATADAFRTRGLGAQAIRLARRALARGAAPDARLYRLLYPVVHGDALTAEAAAQGLDPSLVAALVRQESMFDPLATSRVGARGLMQVMPEVGRALARTLAFPEWDAVLLWQPDVSLALGTAHLADLRGVLPDAVRVLAAYNAGVSRVARWQLKHGAEDPEVFAERIPFAETRDYVRIIQRNQDIYRALYAWDGGAPRASR